MRVLLLTFDAGGNVPPFVEIGRLLSARGHTVRCLGQPSLAARFEQVGVTFQPLQRGAVYNPLALVPLQEQWASFSEVFFGDGLTTDLQQELLLHQPDVVVVDCYLFSALAVLEALKQPCVVLVHTLFGWMLQVGTAFLSQINQTRERAGLQLCHLGREVWAHGSRTLVTSVAGLDTPLPADISGMRYVGPVYPESTTSLQAQPGLQAVDPIVLISFSTTYMGQEALFQRVITAVGQLSVQGLVTVGPAIDVSAFTLPSNVAIHTWLPHAAVLPHVALAITHGGHGSVISALAFGVPLLCLPLGRDQHFIAERVQATGAGLLVPQDAASDAIASAIADLLCDSTYPTAAQHLEQEIRHLGPGTANAVREIEALTASHLVQSPPP